MFTHPCGAAVVFAVYFCLAENAMYKKTSEKIIFGKPCLFGWMFCFFCSPEQFPEHSFSCS